MMSPLLPAPIHWSTGAFAGPAGVSPLELDGLGQHVKQCSVARSRVRALRFGLDSLHRSMLGRFITSLGLLTVLVCAPLLIW